MQIPNAFFWLKFNQGLIHSGRIYKCKRLEVSSCFPQVAEKKSTFQRLATCLRIDTICALFPSLSTPIIQPIHYQGMYTLNSRRFVTEPTVRPPARPPAEPTNQSNPAVIISEIFFPHISQPLICLLLCITSSLRLFALSHFLLSIVTNPPSSSPLPTNQPTNQPQLGRRKGKEKKKITTNSFYPSNRQSRDQNSTSLRAPRASPARSRAAASTLRGLSGSGDASSMRTARTHSRTL